MKLLRILFASISILGFIVFFLALMLQVDSEPKIKKVDCFDRYGHKMIGQVCEEKVWEYTEIGALGVILFFVFGSIALTMDVFE